MTQSKKRWSVLKYGKEVYSSDSFVNAANYAEPGKHDGVWDNVDEDWAMYFKLELESPD